MTRDYSNLKRGRTRAGNRKCQRCKEVWYREKGSVAMLCPRCKAHCSRCDVELTIDNKSKNGAVWSRCKPCATEIQHRSIENTGYSRRDYSLNRKYGITATEYDAILKAQGGGCWICGKVPLEGQNRLAVDHLHSKGEKKRNPREKRGRVRGLLCWGCNAAIGKFRDDITKLRKAAAYLEEWPAQKILNKEKT